MTHDDKVKHIYKELKEKYPEIDYKMMHHFMKKMPAEAYIAFLFYENEENDDFHLRNKMQYDKSVELFEWVENKGTGAKWTCEDILKLASINFESKDYTKYDYCYVMNMLWSDYCNVFQDASYYLKMAKNYLEDPDYMGEASERAFCNARKRIKFHYDD